MVESVGRFSTQARNTYVTPSVAELLKTSPTPRTIRTTLGGAVKETNTEAFLHVEIEGHPVSTYALVIKDFGKDEDGKPIEILFGALAMQQRSEERRVGKECRSRWSP